MAESGGHWSTLAEAQKLTQSTTIPGVVETDIKLNNPIDRVPVAQAANSGVSIKYNREVTTVEDSVVGVDVGEELTWSEDVTYLTVEIALKRIYVQRKLDQFIRDVYGNINNYRAQVLLEMEKGQKRKIGDKMIYGDLTYSSGNKEWDGLHAIAADSTYGTPAANNIDMAEAALSLGKLRLLVDGMKGGVDEFWIPYEIGRRIDAAYQEVGFAGLNTATAGTMGSMSFGWNEAGKRIAYFDGIPFVKTDYLMAEQANTGAGSDARAKYSSGDKQYSVFAVKLGNVFDRVDGITFGYGGTEGAGDLYKLVLFANLEDYDAEGMRMITYGAMLWGGPFAVGRIYDIEDVAVVI